MNTTFLKQKFKDKKMNLEDKEKLKKELQEHINSLKKELVDLEARIKPISYDKAHGRMGGIDAMKQKTFQKMQAESLESRLLDLEQNLANVDNPSFGVCECCGGAIGEERHKVLPETKKCVKCAF